MTIGMFVESMAAGQGPSRSGPDASAFQFSENFKAADYFWRTVTRCRIQLLRE